ncbi:MAG: alpha/beta hydrolase [Thermodesulfobacteriota bacterium]
MPFSVGVHKFLPEPNMNFQLNRLVNLGGAPFPEVRAASVRIKNLEQWNSVFLGLAEAAETQGRLEDASAYFRSAEFFIRRGDPRKRPAFDRSVELFRKARQEDFAVGRISAHEVPYEGKVLYAWRFAGQGKGTVVIHGGFDSTMEEMFPAVQFLASDSPYDLILFEGPGQGSVLRRQELPMTPQWEKPTAAVLDHFGLKDVTLVGVSLGGYLGLRAAAYEPRIRRVVAWDVLYDFFDVLMASAGKNLSKPLRALISSGAAGLVNRAVAARMRMDSFSEWGINHGMHVLGANTPFEFFKKAQAYTMKGISHLLTQDVLLLAGTDDHFVPLPLFFRQAQEMTNVRSFTGRIFTRAEEAENHCQVGNIPLALSVIKNWIEQTAKA